MKAAVCYEFGQPLCIETIEIDPPQTGEIKVRLSACAICHSDIHYLDGAWGGSLPAVFGHEAAGVVVAVGPQVTQVQPGEHVVVTLIRACGHCFFCVQGIPTLCEGIFALDNESRLRNKVGQPILQGLRTGAFAEYIIVDQSQAIPIPKTIPLDHASLLACGVITGLGAVTNTAQMPPGCSAVIIGAGGVGLNSIQGAALSGGYPIIALDLIERKRDAALAFGATHVIDPTAVDATATVKSLTYGRGADYVFVTVGNVKAMEQGVTMLRRGGTLVVVGMPATGAKSHLELGNLANDSQRILGGKMGSACPQIDIPKLITLYEQGRLKLDALITAHYPLTEINAAIAAAKRGEVLRSVIVF